MLCENCNKEIEYSVIEIHKANCSKFCIDCTKCRQKISKSTEKDHMLQFHAMKTCNYCFKEFEQYVFDSHECHNPPVTCEVCEAVFPSDQYEQHFYTCGNRTTQCPQCKATILLKDFKSHSSTSGKCMPPKNYHKSIGTSTKENVNDKNEPDPQILFEFVPLNIPNVPQNFPVVNLNMPGVLNIPPNIPKPSPSLPNFAMPLSVSMSSSLPKKKNLITAMSSVRDADKLEVKVRIKHKRYMLEKEYVAYSKKNKIFYSGSNELLEAIERSKIEK
jgi:hypothetical protein